MNATPQRDAAIDILKGIGCLVMIVAHSSLNIGGYDRLKFWGGLAPVLFYSAVGVTAAFQAQKYKPRGVILTYAFLILLGFSFNRITDPGFLEEIEFDIVQMIAVGSLIVYFLEYYARPRTWIYFILGLTIFGAKFLLQAAFKGVAIAGLTNLLFPPGIFPIFPWLCLFMFGLFAYRVPNYVNAGAAFGFGALLFALSSMNVALDIENKWDMSVGYFLACNILLFASFFILRALTYLQNVKTGLLTFLGKNSLLFLYVHFPIILYLKELRVHRTVKLIFNHPYLFWILSLLLTLAVMFALLWLARQKFPALPFDYLPTWIVMTLLVFAIGIFVSSKTYTYYGEIALGILTALFYPQLGNILKERAT